MSASFVQAETYVDDSELAHRPNLTTDDYAGWIQTWLAALAPQLSPINAYEVSLKLTDDAQIQQLNAQYRAKDQPTDVLSFAALETDMPGLDALHEQHPLNLGDIIISVETAFKQALKAQHSTEHELAWLSAHGLLHLLGWDHPDDESLRRMLSKQVELLRLVNINFQSTQYGFD